MTRITIVLENSETSDVSFRAMARELQAVGPTAGAALDALTRQLEPSETGTLVVVQKARPDTFFTVAQQQRLNELLRLRQNAGQQGHSLSTPDKKELELLVDAE